MVSNGTLNLTFRAALTQYPVINAIELVLQQANPSRYGSISGTVVQAGTNTPVAGAKVVANGDAAITDNTGSYAFAHVLPGSYTASASALKLLSSTQTVAVIAGTAAANFTLASAQPVATPQSATTAGVAIPIVLRGTDPQGGA